MQVHESFPCILSGRLLNNANCGNHNTSFTKVKDPKLFFPAIFSGWQIFVLTTPEEYGIKQIVKHI
jgi:hypothetical protein